MAETKNEVKIIKQDYDYMFLSDIFEMLRGVCCIIHDDKKLFNLFTELANYVNSCLPNIDGEIIDYELIAHVKK